jgi:hypothetical protein
MLTLARVLASLGSTLGDRPVCISAHFRRTLGEHPLLPRKAFSFEQLTWARGT